MSFFKNLFSSSDDGYSHDVDDTLPGWEHEMDRDYTSKVMKALKRGELNGQVEALKQLLAVEKDTNNIGKLQLKIDELKARIELLEDDLRPGQELYGGRKTRRRQNKRIKTKRKYNSYTKNKKKCNYKKKTNKKCRK
jgi:predicted component of type VI protein secretion system